METVKDLIDRLELSTGLEVTFTAPGGEVASQRIFGWGYCDACDDLHECTDERVDVLEWVGLDDPEEHDDPTPVFVGTPAWLRAASRGQGGLD